MASSTDPSDCGGRSFHRKAPTQRAIMALLKGSPLPWTSGMILDWFGMGSQGGPFLQAIRNGRVEKVARGLYTCPCKAPLKRTPITDDYINERFGFNL